MILWDPTRLLYLEAKNSARELLAEDVIKRALHEIEPYLPD